jgi:hypothetical protein
VKGIVDSPVCDYIPGGNFSSTFELTWTPLANRKHPFFMILGLKKEALFGVLLICLGSDCIGKPAAHGCSRRLDSKRRTPSDLNSKLYRFAAHITTLRQYIGEPPRECFFP